MECNGKCSITKASEDVNKERNDLALNSFQQKITFYIYTLVPEDEVPLFKTSFSNFEYLNKYTFLFTHKIVHPPMRVS